MHHPTHCRHPCRHLAESLAIAAGAADALILSCTFLDAIAVVGQHGAREGLQGLVQRAKEARNANTQETVSGKLAASHSLKP